MNKKITPYFILFLAVLLLAVDIRLPLMPYPAFEPLSRRRLRPWIW